jgi:hypothetical protein
MAHRPAAEKFFVVMLTVRGRGVFPFDMLRYDRAVPATEADSGLLHGDSLSPVRDVKLRAFKGAAAPGYDGHSIARWKSFGWKVIRAEDSDAQPLYRDLEGLKEGERL